MRTKSLSPRLAAVLLQAQLLTEIQLQTAVHEAQKTNHSLLVYLLQHFPINTIAIAQACARYFGLAYRELADFRWENLPMALIDEKMIQQHPVLPLVQAQQLLQVAVCDPDDFPLLEDIQYQT